MPAKPKTRTREWLKAVRAENTEPRVIKAAEYMSIHCNFCSEVFSARVGNVDNCLKKRGFGYRCKECNKKNLSEKASSRTGDKNPFYGKSHSKETKQKISEVKKEQTKGLGREFVVEKCRKMRDASYKKYDGNPMSDPEVKKKHRESVTSKEFTKNARYTGLDRASDPEFTEFMKKQSDAFWASPDSIKTREKLREFYTDQFNKSDGKYYQKRIKALSEFYKDQNQIDLANQKRQNSFLQKYGVDNPMKNPDIRKKVFSEKGPTAPEKKIFEMLSNRGLNFEYQYSHGGKTWDFCIFDSSCNPDLLIEIDGEYYHGLTSDCNNTKVGGHKDPARFEQAGDVKMLVLDGKRVDEGIPLIIEILGADYADWINSIYLDCKGKPFPYPEYDDKRMMKDWKNLKEKWIDSKFNSRFMPANSIVTNFHKSIYTSRVRNKLSPVEAWGNDDKLLKCIENRFIYSSKLSSQNIARGFEKNSIAPRVSVFQPYLARHLLAKYCPEAKTVVDPFSGFSGRMLGSVSLGMKYTGYDIRDEVVLESNKIIDYLGDEVCGAKVITADFETNTDITEYDVLITCPPYGNKEVWFDDQKCSNAEYYIKKCLEKFRAKKYIFVVDDPGEFEVAEELSRESHLSRSTEFVVIIDSEK